MTRLAALLAIAAPVLWPRAAPAQELTLAAAVDQALAGNLVLEATRQGVEEARGRRQQSRSAHLPQLSISENVVRSNDAVSAFGFRLRQERFGPADFAVDRLNRPGAMTEYQTSLWIEQPLFAGGQILAHRRQAEAGLQVAQYELQRSRQEVALRTAEAYWGLALAIQVEKAVDQALETASVYQAAIQARSQEQRALRVDVLAAQVRVAELQGQRIEAANGVAEARDRLTLLLGLDSSAEVVPADSLAAVPVSISAPEMVGAAVQGRPDLAAAEQRVAAARHGVRAARAQYLPQVDAFARVELDAADPFARQGESWTAGSMATWSFSVGTAGAVHQAQAQARQAQARQDLLRQQVERQVLQACRQVEAARTRIEVAARAVEQATERQRLSELRYREGSLTVAELLEAQTGNTQAAIRHLEARRDLRVGLAQLEYAAARPVAAAGDR